MNPLPALGFFGGTFDPVHRGHITLAEELKNHLALDAMYLVPCHLPPHRVIPAATDQQRLQMLRLASADTTLQIDDSELRRQGPSYTVETLRALRRQHGHTTALVWCMGMDAFALFDTWHQWQEILGLAHLAVVSRATYTGGLNRVVQTLQVRHQCHDPQDLKKSPAGNIYLTQLSQIPVSSTELRQQLASCAAPPPALHPAVYQYILERGLYLPR